MSVIVPCWVKCRIKFITCFKGNNIPSGRKNYAEVIGILLSLEENRNRMFRLDLNSIVTVIT